MEHDCVIGLLAKHDERYLVTIEELEKHIADSIDFFDWIKENGYSLFPGNRTSAYTLSDYTDFRKNTDLHRFMYCPYCGQKIDWKQIRRTDNGNENKT